MIYQYSVYHFAMFIYPYKIQVEQLKIKKKFLSNSMFQQQSQVCYCLHSNIIKKIVYKIVHVCGCEVQAT